VTSESSLAVLSVDRAFVRGFTGTALVALLTRPDGRIIAINAAFARYLGRQADDVAGEMLADLPLWRDDQKRRILGELLLHSGASVGEIFSFVDSEQRWFEGMVSMEPMDRNGQQLAFLWVRDVRAHTDRAHALRRELDSYFSLFQEAQEGIYRSLPDHAGFLAINPSLARMFGYSSTHEMMTAVSGRVSHLYVDPDVGRQISDELFRLGHISGKVAQLYRADGSTFWTSENARAIYDQTGSVLFYEGTLVDITQLVDRERRIRESSTLYRVLVEDLRDGVFLIQRGIVKFCNSAFAGMLGYSSDELIDQRYMNYVASSSFNEQLERKLDRERGSRVVQAYQIELICKDGAVRRFAIRADAVEYEGDIASTGTMRDITQDALAQRLLVEAEAKYRTLFMDAVVGMFRSSFSGEVLEINQAMAELLGYDSPASALKSIANVGDLYANGFERESTRKRLRHEGRVFNIERQLVRRDGRLIWILCNVRAVTDANGVAVSLEGSVQDITERRAVEMQLAYQAEHDVLTGLLNRFGFSQALERFLARSDRHPATVLLIDLDGFKVVNDSLGHAVGDELLVHFAQRLKSLCPVDTVVSRYGGDEFILLATALDADGAKQLAREILSGIRAGFQMSQHLVFSSASIGIALIAPDAEDSSEHLLRDADVALYQAKAQGKASLAMFDSTMRERAVLRQQLETELRLAMDHGELRVFYQPIVSVQTLEVVAVEALLRWQHPVHGLLAPDRFLKVADETGLIVKIDWWVLGEACAQLKRWMRQYGDLAPTGIAVNVDDSQFTQPDFVLQLGHTLSDLDLDPAHLRLEVTETVFRHREGDTVQVLRALKELGVKLVVDDFGTGYSSLVSFSLAPFDTLKIDRSFIADLDVNRRHRAIVRTIAQFAIDLGIELVAEGVEEQSQLDYLSTLSCDQAQGFLFSRAIPAEEFERKYLLSRQRIA
jgi:diguanylate cyclase (GGDEF)-like protein/PAS domain S-box-containing protein